MAMPKETSGRMGIPANDFELLEQFGVLTPTLAGLFPDAVREAFYNLTAMYSHRCDGTPTQYTYPKEVRDAAVVLLRAVLSQQGTQPAPSEVLAGIEKLQLDLLQVKNWMTQERERGERLQNEVEALRAALSGQIRHG